MYCSSCGTLLAHGAQFCNGCGTRTATGAAASGALSTEKRPVAGIAVSAVLGTIGVVWGFVAMYKAIYADVEGMQAAIYQAFPAFQNVALLGSSIGILGSAALLIGVVLVLLRHANGPKTVRITSYCMLAAALLVLVASYFAMASAPSWQTLDASTKGALLGGIIGGAIGGLAQWGLILFLFRNSRWP